MEVETPASNPNSVANPVANPAQTVVTLDSKSDQVVADADALSLVDADNVSKKFVVVCGVDDKDNNNSYEFFDDREVPLDVKVAAFNVEESLLSRSGLFKNTISFEPNLTKVEFRQCKPFLFKRILQFWEAGVCNDPFPIVRTENFLRPEDTNIDVVHAKMVEKWFQDSKIQYYDLLHSLQYIDEVNMLKVCGFRVATAVRGCDPKSIPERLFMPDMADKIPLAIADIEAMMEEEKRKEEEEKQKQNAAAAATAALANASQNVNPNEEMGGDGDDDDDNDNDNENENEDEDEDEDENADHNMN